LLLQGRSGADILGSDAGCSAKVMDWLATSETEAEHQCAEVRLGDNVGRDCNAELAQSTSIAYSDPVPISPDCPDVQVLRCKQQCTKEHVMADVKIEVRPNGPYIINGSIELRDTNGNVLPTQDRTVLCRCGASTKKPFCDGTHSKVGFQAAEQAVPGSAE
jgi:CDGSH-type Zn-finger protein